MVVLNPRRVTRGRTVGAVALAVCAHLLALLALGWRIPKTDAPEAADDRTAAVEVTLIRPRPEPAPRAAPPASGRASSAPSVTQRLLIAPAPGAPTLSAPVQEPPASEVAQGAPDCAVEDLPLLTDAEKARCRNQIDADTARRLARDADERAARQVAEAQRGPQTYRMASEKEAYYNAVVNAYKSPGHPPVVTCVLPGMHIKRPHHGLKLGPCVLIPPQGTLTEEIHLDPLDPEWRPAPPKP